MRFGNRFMKSNLVSPGKKKINPLAVILLTSLCLPPLAAVAQKPVDPAAPKINVDNSPAYYRPDPFLSVEPVPVGRPAPDFSVLTAEGKPLGLKQYKNKKWLVLVFYQGHFCSVCGQQLSNLQKHYTDFQSQGAEILAISADDVNNAQLTLGEKGLSFQVVPDPQKTLIKAFGVANQSRKQIAWPSVFIIDKKGIVRYGYAEHSGHRLHSGEILGALSKLTGKPAPKLGYDD